MKFGLATCLDCPYPDDDEALTIEAFKQEGHQCELVAWDDPSADLGQFDAVVVRSTWNYPNFPKEFAHWIRDASDQTILLNPPELMLGNMDKRYLNELERNGIPIIPSRFLYPSNSQSLKNLVTGDFVLKPAIGAGSQDTVTFSQEQIEEAASWLQEKENHRLFMIQPLVESVYDVGEQSIIQIGSDLTHRIRKRPSFNGEFQGVEGPLEVTQEFEDISRQITFGIADILYARIDLMYFEGRWCLSELELIEPSLFFSYAPFALPKFVETAERLVQSGK